MSKGRLEAFSDGVIAIIITIMVLELRVPHGTHWTDLRPVWPLFLCYLYSFIFLAMYWNNHHHLFHAVQHVGGGVLWANLHLLFWLSLIPFVTEWTGESTFASWPVAIYGCVCFMAGIAYSILTRVLIRRHGHDSPLALAVKGDGKGNISVAMYALAIPMAFFRPGLAFLLYASVTFLWIVPDRRIEKALGL